MHFPLSRKTLVTALIGSMALSGEYAGAMEQLPPAGGGNRAPHAMPQPAAPERQGGALGLDAPAHRPGRTARDDMAGR